MKKLLITIFTIFIAMSLTNCGSDPNLEFCDVSAEKGIYICEKTLTNYFDTTISLKLYYQSEEEYSVEEVLNYFEETTTAYHEYFDNYHEYDGINNVYTINHTDGPLVIDQILYDAIDYALNEESSLNTEDTPLFNIALGPVLEIWHNARESNDCDTTIELGISYCPVPRDQIDGVEFNTDPADIIMNPNDMTIEFAKPNMSIDLGGYAKGYLTDILAYYLNDLGINYLLNVGNSNVVSGGINPIRDDELFYIALTEPTTDFTLGYSYFLYLKIPENLAVVTSGNYQRFFKGLDDYEVYHHIIDPNTNYPGGYSMSVTILYPDSALADILSTMLYLMPLDDALAYVESTDDLEAVWYHYDGTVSYSSGFEAYVYTPE